MKLTTASGNENVCDQIETRGTQTHASYIWIFKTLNTNLTLMAYPWGSYLPLVVYSNDADYRNGLYQLRYL